MTADPQGGKRGHSANSSCGTRCPFPHRPHRWGRHRVILVVILIFASPAAAAVAAVAPLEEDMPPVRFNLATYRRTPAVRRSRLITMVIAPLSLLSSPPPLSSLQAVVVAAFISIDLRMNPSTFFIARGPMRNVRRFPVRNS